MPFKGGIDEAAKMLAGLDRQGRENVLEIIGEKDPQMAEKLRENMVTIEDLRFLTVKMIQELLREINIGDLALALRISSPELKTHILQNVSSSIRNDIEEVLLGKLQSVSTVNEAADKVMEVVLNKISKGELVINKNGETLV
jgi:flagellar motor switch protein FliG